MIMISDKSLSPFPTTGYFGPKYFCDREEETQTLITRLESGESSLILGIRRLGKTALMHHVLAQLPKSWNTIYLDILHTENEAGLLNALASGLLRSIPEKSLFGSKVWAFVKSLRPTISFDPLSGTPQVGFDVKDPDSHVKDIFQFLAKSDRLTVIAIDEFQQIAHYPEKNTDAWLRSQLQVLPQVRFLFAGSQQHILSELFTDPGKPFFKSATPLKIGKIENEAYASFIINTFKSHGRQISIETTNEVLHWAQHHTYYVQLLCNRVFATGKKKINSEVWQQEANKLLIENEPFFYHYRSMLTSTQWTLLKAIAKENVVKEPSSKSFISKYQLGSSASVLRSLESLQQKELVFKEYDENGNPFYSVYDVLFEQWIAGKFTF